MHCEFPLSLDRSFVVPYQVGRDRQGACLPFSLDCSAVRISAADRIGTGRKEVIPRFLKVLGLAVVAVMAFSAFAAALACAA